MGDEGGSDVRWRGVMSKRVSRSCLIAAVAFAGAFFRYVSACAYEVPFEYDANGNLISGEGKYYEYNDANRLVRVRQDDAVGPVLAEYVYDSTGQRVKKVEGGITTYYIGKHFNTRTESGEKRDASYFFANSERVAKKDDGAVRMFFTLDHLRSTNVLSDTNGVFAERNQFYPFGEIRLKGTEKYLYTGKERDELTRFDYFEARYYHSEVLHFVQPDPIVQESANPQSLNRYAYVQNRPINFTDPYGLWSFKEGVQGAKQWIADKFQELGEAAGIVAEKIEDKVESVVSWADKNYEKLSSGSLEVAKKLADAPNVPVVFVKGHFRSGKYVAPSLRRAPGAVKSGAIGIGYLVGPVIQATQDAFRDDLSVAQRAGRYSFSIIPGVDEVAQATAGLGAYCYDVEYSHDELTRDYFSDKNPLVGGLSSAFSKIDGIDKWTWLDGFGSP